MSIQRVRSKWAKTAALLADPDLMQYVPVTRLFSRSALMELLGRFGMVYVKPVNGTFGKGVIRVERRNDKETPYGFQAGVQKYRCPAFGDLYRRLSLRMRGKKYLIQQGIELLRYGNRRFDIRIMVQKNPDSKWETTGMIGRLAHPRKIVTNYHSGGTPLPVQTLLSRHMDGQSLASFQSRLETLGTAAAKAMQRKFPGLKEIGVDVAVDADHRPWILEVNTLPDPFIFRMLPDRSVFRKMYRYAAAYGRFHRFRRKPRRKAM